MMNLTHLRYAVEVERTGSINQAARNLFMGQPNLSKAIKELEGETGITLFKRTAKGVQPTAKGEEFLSYAKTILSQMDELESLYKPHQDNAVHLHVAAPRAAYLSAAFADYIASLSGDLELDIRFQETDAVTAIQQISAGEADFGVIRYQQIYEDYFLHLIADKRLQYEPLLSFPLRLLLSREHPLAKLSEIPCHLLSGFTEVAQGDFHVPALSFSQIKKSAVWESASRRIYVYDRGSQLDLLQRVPTTFAWVSPMPREALSPRGLVLRDCVPAPLLSHDILVRPKKQPLHFYAKQCMEFFKEEITRQGS